MRPINLVTIIDDDEIVSFIERKIIEQTNLVNQIKLFSNGKEAIDFLKTNSKQPNLLPEIILLDLNMPVMNGFQFLEEYIKLEPHLGKKTTIYVVSSSVSPSDMNRIKSISEVNEYIIKPITRERFEKIVRLLTEKSMSQI